MRGSVSHTRGRHPAESHGSGTHDDGIRRPHAGAHVANDRGGLTADEDGRTTGADYRSSYVGDGHDCRRHHRADMHIG